MTNVPDRFLGTRNFSASSCNGLFICRKASINSSFWVMIAKSNGLFPLLFSAYGSAPIPSNCFAIWFLISLLWLTTSNSRLFPYLQSLRFTLGWYFSISWSISHWLLATANCAAVIPLTFCIFTSIPRCIKSNTTSNFFSRTATCRKL